MFFGCILCRQFGSMTYVVKKVFSRIICNNRPGRSFSQNFFCKFWRTLHIWRTTGEFLNSAVSESFACCVSTLKKPERQLQHFVRRSNKKIFNPCGLEVNDLLENNYEEVSYTQYLFWGEEVVLMSSEALSFCC